VVVFLLYHIEHFASKLLADRIVLFELLFCWEFRPKSQGFSSILNQEYFKKTFAAQEPLLSVCCSDLTRKEEESDLGCRNDCRSLDLDCG